MRTFISLLLLLPLLAGCGSGGGSDAGDDGGGTAPPPASIAKQGDISDLGTSGIFNTSETDQTITVWQGARLGEVTFRSTTLDHSFTGRDGDTFAVPLMGGTATFRLDYDPDTHLLRLVRPSHTSDTATWTIIEPMPAGRG